MSKEDALGLPVTVDLMTTARALGISRSLAYHLAATDEYPIKLYKVGNRYRATRADLLAYLGISED